VWFSAWSIIGAIAPNPWMLVGARFMAGIASARSIRSPIRICRMCCRRLIVDDWPRGPTPARSSRSGAGFLSLSLNGHKVFGMDSWRVLLILGAIGALFVIVLRRGLPEFAALAGERRRTDEAQAALRLSNPERMRRPTTPMSRDDHRKRSRFRP
jgi:putative MFS transporter